MQGRRRRPVLLHRRLLQSPSARRSQQFPRSSISGPAHQGPTKAPPPPAFGSAPLRAPVRTPSHGSGAAPYSDPAPLLALSKLGPQLVRTLFQIPPLLPTQPGPQASHAHPVCVIDPPISAPTPASGHAHSPGGGTLRAPPHDPAFPSASPPVFPRALPILLAPPPAGRPPPSAPPSRGRGSHPSTGPAPPLHLAAVPAAALCAHHAVGDGTVMVLAQVAGGAVEHRQE